jgi:hypothetical protein
MMAHWHGKNSIRFLSLPSSCKSWLAFKYALLDHDSTECVLKKSYIRFLLTIVSPLIFFAFLRWWLPKQPIVPKSTRFVTHQGPSLTPLLFFFCMDTLTAKLISDVSPASGAAHRSLPLVGCWVGVSFRLPWWSWINHRSMTSWLLSGIRDEPT